MYLQFLLNSSATNGGEIPTYCSKEERRSATTTGSASSTRSLSDVLVRVSLLRKYPHSVPKHVIAMVETLNVHAGVWHFSS